MDSLEVREQQTQAARGYGREVADRLTTAGYRDDQIVAFLDGLRETFCLECGSETHGERCYCTRDD